MRDQLGDFLLELFWQFDSRRARGMKEDSDIFRITKVSDRPLRLIRLWLYRPGGNDCPEVPNNPLWISEVLPVRHPLVAHGDSTFCAAIVRRWMDISPIACRPARVFALAASGH